MKIPPRTTVQQQVPLAMHTTLRIGGECRYWLEPADGAELVELLSSATVCWRVIGAGSNTLVNDEKFDGAVVSTKRLNEIDFLGDGLVKAAAGVKLPYLVRACAARGLSGISFLSHIPGTVGGAIVNNAGRFGSRTIGHRVKEVEIWDGSNVCLLSRSQLLLGDRSTVFMKHPDWIVLSATLQLPTASATRIAKEITEHFRTIVSGHDHSGPNAGSVFVRPQASVMNKLQGRSHGPACWSSVRQNWIVAEKGARCVHVLKLLEEAWNIDPSLRLEWQTMGAIDFVRGLRTQPSSRYNPMT